MIQMERGLLLGAAGDWGLSVNVTGMLGKNSPGKQGRSPIWWIIHRGGRRRAEIWTGGELYCKNNFINYRNSAFFLTRLVCRMTRTNSGLTWKYQYLMTADAYPNARKTHVSCKTNASLGGAIDVGLLPHFSHTDKETCGELLLPSNIYTAEMSVM